MQREQILQKIDDYLNGKLSTGEIEELWVEILDQPEYVDYINTLVNVKEVLENRKKTVSFWKKNRNWIGAIAAVLTVIILFSLIKFNIRSIEFSTVRQIQSSELESPAATRSLNEHFTKSDSLLNLGYIEATKGNVSKAIGYFNELALQNGDNANVAKAYFNIGVLNYNSENFEKAESSFINTLDNLQNDDILKEKTSWYLGNTYVKLGDLRQAKERLTKVINMNGIYKEKASDLLKKIDQQIPQN